MFYLYVALFHCPGLTKFQDLDSISSKKGQKELKFCMKTTIVFSQMQIHFQVILFKVISHFFCFNQIFFNLQVFFEPLILVIMHEAIKASPYAYIRPILTKLLIGLFVNLFDEVIPTKTSFISGAIFGNVDFTWVKTSATLMREAFKN